MVQLINEHYTNNENTTKKLTYAHMIPFLDIILGNRYVGILPTKMPILKLHVFFRSSFSFSVGYLSSPSILRVDSEFMYLPSTFFCECVYPFKRIRIGIPFSRFAEELSFIPFSKLYIHNRSEANRKLVWAGYSPTCLGATTIWALCATR